MSIGHYEYANALTYVYGDDEREKAIAQLKQAVAIKPINAMEALEVAHAKKLLAGFEQTPAPSARPTTCRSATTSTPTR